MRESVLGVVRVQGLARLQDADTKEQNRVAVFAIGGFEGGQMPIYRRMPQRGFTNHNRPPLA